jgi:hypothetical protein
VRYCTGGYVFQIEDAKAGALLSGPTYPDSFNWFDGQGIPDAFHLSPLHESQGPGPNGRPLALVLGIGICDLQAKEVHAFCDWAVTQHPKRIAMKTEQEYESFAVELERTVSLEQRTVRSATRLRNRGKMPIPMRWYPHPFYPQPETDELLKLNLPLAEIEDEGYRLGENGFIARKGWPWDKGYYLPLNHRASTNLVVLQKHPLLGLVAATCSYIPDYFPIWGNPRTFSWEPFLERTVGPGQELAWWIDYEF